MLNSVITVNPRALQDADRLDVRFKQTGLAGPLDGIPILVKDEIDTSGMPTTLGTLVFKDYRPPKDAFVIGRLRQAGAIILGKTTLSEFAAGDTYGSMFGVTRNPYDPPARQEVLPAARAPHSRRISRRWRSAKRPSRRSGVPEGGTRW